MDTAVNRYFAAQKKEIQDFLKRFLSERRQDFTTVNRWGPGACDLLMEFTASGKMIRGGLVILAQQLFAGHSDVASCSAQQPQPHLACGGFKAAEAGIAVAAALELFQSALLIHDDIADRDTMRRGRPSLFYQYCQRGQAENFGTAAYHFGESMGICLGDLAFFLGYEILGAITADCGIGGSLYRLFSRELALVGLGQMEDIYLGQAHGQAREADILNVYRYKTSRYTFSLPLMAGAMLAEMPQPVIAKLEKLGENLGIVFQIRDDELGLFGDAAALGKPVGSDIKEGKMTLYMYYLLQNPDSNLANWILSLQNAPVNDSDLTKIGALIVSEGIQAKVDRLVATLTSEVRLLMAELPFQSPAHRALLEELVEYNLTRKR